jgi:hypothetical protein
MYFHTPKHVYLTYFNDEIVALNLKKDQYIILSKELSEILGLILNNKFELVSGKYQLSISNCEKVILPSNFYDNLKYFQEIDILCKHTFNYPNSKFINKKKPSAGASNVDWKIEYGDLDKKVSKWLVLEAYYSLIKVYFILKVFGFYSLIKVIKRKNNSKFQKRNLKEFNILVTALNRACFYYPVRTKCLEWSAALAMLALKRRWKCNIEIGVQNLPFVAHAWVKSNGKVIADTENLPKTLSVILSEPF